MKGESIVTVIPFVIILSVLSSMIWSETMANSTSNNGRLTDTMDKNKPRNVVIDILNATSINLKWEPPKEADSVKCPVLRYTIRLKTEGAKKSRTWKIDASRQHVALHDLQPESTYYVRLLAVVCDGKGKPSRWLRVRTSDSHVTTGGGGASPDVGEELNAPGKPTYVRTRTFPDSVIVSWLPPDDTTVIRGYMVGYGEGVPDVNWQYVEAARKNVTIKNLKPATQYIVSLRAFNNFGKGPVVYDLIYTREFVVSTAGPAGTPTDLRALILSPTTAWLKWVDPYLGRQQQLTDSRYYNVHYQALSLLPPAIGGELSPPSIVANASSSSSSSSSPGKSLSVIVKALHVVLYDLTPGTRYEFKVRTVKDAQASQFSDAVVNKTFETAPSSPPRSLSILGTNSSTVVLASWRPPRYANGDVTRYLVMYTPDVNLPTDKWQVVSVAGNETETIVTNLWPNKTYHFRVQARNSDGYSPMSASVTHYTRAQSDAEMRRPSAPLANETRSSSTALVPPDVDKSANIDFSNVDIQEGGTRKDIEQSAYDYGIDGSEPDDEDDDNDDVTTTNDESKAIALAQTQPNSKPLMKSTTGDVKKKREQNQRERSNVLTPGYRSQQLDELQISFSAVVKHDVSAFITWPETMESCPSREGGGVGGISDGSGVKISSVIGYTLHYRLDEANKVDGSTHRSSSTSGVVRGGGGQSPSGRASGRYHQPVDRNLTVNMAVLDHLQSNSRYRFRIRYLLSNGLMSAWSQEQLIDTHEQHPHKQ